MVERSSRVLLLLCLAGAMACSSDRRLGGTYTDGAGAPPGVGGAAASGGTASVAGAAFAGGDASSGGSGGSGGAGPGEELAGAPSFGEDAVQHLGQDPRIAVDRDDNAVWAWHTAPEPGTPGTHRLFVSHWSGQASSWSMEQVVWEGDARAILGPLTLREGRAQLLYLTEDEGASDAERYRIWLRTSSPTGLGAPQSLGVAGRGWWQDPTLPELEMREADDGRTLVVWGDPTNGGRQLRVSHFYDPYDSNGGWRENAVDVVEGEWLRRASLDGAGGAIVIWSAGMDVLFREYTPATSWSTAQLLATDGTGLGKVVSGRDGEMWITTTGGSGEALRHYRPGAGWSEEARLPGGEPVLALAPSGGGAVAAVGSECAVFAATYEPDLGWSERLDLPDGTGFVWSVAANDDGASWFLGSRGVEEGLGCQLASASFAHALAGGVTIELGEVPAASLEVASGGNALLAWQHGGSVYARWLSAAQ